MVKEKLALVMPRLPIVPMESADENVEMFKPNAKELAKMGIQ